MILITKALSKMDKAERAEIRNGIKNPVLLFCLGFLVIGLWLSWTGRILAIIIIQHIGAGMIFIGLVAISIIGWREGKMNLLKSALIIFLAIIGLIVYL